MNAIEVQTAGGKYEILISSSDIEQYHRKIVDSFNPDKIVLITDENVSALYLKAFKNLSTIPTKTIVLPPGENTKSFANYQNLCEEILEFGITRKSVLIALGGGVIGDLVGFAASTLLRGLRFVQVPTSLLAQVDSSVGGKTAINSHHGKNLIGAFHQPSLVLIDTQTNRTLDRLEFVNGYAEVVKYGLIHDAEFFDWLDANLKSVLAMDKASLQTAIHKCCQIKADFVEKDEREQNIRAFLNFGHTFGHAIEALSKYSIAHGAAVAIGMAMASRLSLFKGMLKEDEHFKIVNHLERATLPTTSNFTIEDMVPFMKKDKKLEAGGGLTLILLQKIGEAVKMQVDEAELLRCFSASQNS